MFQEQIIWMQLQPPNNLAQEQKKTVTSITHICTFPWKVSEGELT